jgi:hypothetical protein
VRTNLGEEDGKLKPRVSLNINRVPVVLPAIRWHRPEQLSGLSQWVFHYLEDDRRFDLRLSLLEIPRRDELDDGLLRGFFLGFTSRSGSVGMARICHGCVGSGSGSGYILP